jgi:hypothetical protein
MMKNSAPMMAMEPVWRVPWMAVMSDGLPYEWIGLVRGLPDLRARPQLGITLSQIFPANHFFRHLDDENKHYGACPGLAMQHEVRDDWPVFAQK